MQFIQPQCRQQMSIHSLESLVGPDNPVRLIDAFVEHLDLKKLGFAVAELAAEGRPAFDSRVFLKLYFYGYLNGLRSSRRLERECRHNTELQWLIGALCPNYHSIANFRKNNPGALRSTFKLFVLFLKDAALVSGEVVAIDGTKVRAHNSRKNNVNPKKIQRHLAYIEEKTNSYLTALDELDKQEQCEKVKSIQDKLQRLKDNQIKYEALSDFMEEMGESQLSTTDPDSRALLVQGQVVEVAYNVQTAVDQKHNLIVATHTINRNDRNALSSIATEAKANLGVAEMTLLADKGYYNAREINLCIESNITTIVAIPEIVNSNETGTTAAYMSDKFVYHPDTDTYTCPEGQTLHTNGTRYTKTKTQNSTPYQYKKYHTKACKKCPVLNLCTAQSKGRQIERSEFAQAAADNAQRFKDNWPLYRKRQEINEHIFGTIKRKWGYNHTNLIGLNKVNGEMALIMTVYNLRRVFNIMKFNEFLEALKKWKPNYEGIVLRFLKTWLKPAFCGTPFFQLVIHKPKMRVA